MEEKGFRGSGFERRDFETMIDLERKVGERKSGAPFGANSTDSGQIGLPVEVSGNAEKHIIW